MQYRKDINGLRAIAVLAVVLFHFNSSLVPGGFAGVDIFFVISGFLMTGIIFKGVENSDFSITSFYISRANRIIPALAFLCLVLLVLGFFFLTFFDYLALSKHALLSVTFLSNIGYWLEVGYFDSTADEKWLLHTWSLSVEWQFYILYPLVIVGLKKFFSVRVIKILIIFAVILGFVFCVLISFKKPDFSYYMLPARAWEMLVGGLVFLYPIDLGKCSKKILEILGYSLIVFSFFGLSKDNAWPGYMALFPVVGAVLIIYINNQVSLVTGNIISQRLGSWSYSIYLWHWPIVVFNTYYPVDGWVYIGIILSLVFGWISYRYVELMPINGGFLNSKIKSKSVALFAISLVLSCASYLYIFNFLKANAELVEPYVKGHMLYDNEQSESVSGKRVYFNGATENKFEYLMIGDSHVGHYSYGLDKLGEMKVIMSWVSSCMNFPDVTTKPYASWMNDKWLEACKNNYKVVLEYPDNDVILGQQWSRKELLCISEKCEENILAVDYYQVLKLQISRLVDIVGPERKLFIIGQVPAPYNSMVKCMKRFINDTCEQSTNEFYADRLVQNRMLAETADQYENVYFINPFDAVCDDKFLCETIKDGKNLFYDIGHLSAFGSAEIWPFIEKSIRKIKKDS